MFINIENRNELRDAVDIANRIRPQVLERVRARKDKFLCSNATPQKVAELIETFDQVMRVETYFTRNRRVLGYFVRSKPTTIHLNRAAFPRKTESLVATLWHELIHAVDHFAKDHYFHHDGNRFRNWKKETAPYWIGELAGELALVEMKRPVVAIEQEEWIEERYGFLGLQKRWTAILSGSESEGQDECEVPFQCDNTQGDENLFV